MKKKFIELYKETLFAKDKNITQLKTYAIVDSIRDEKVKAEIFFSELPYIDLWDKELSQNTLEVPLYLVELKEENNLIEYLLNQQDKSIATYFLSPYNLEELQSYYSSFTYPEIEVEKGEFKRAIFGFYDPKVLFDYIPTLYTDEKIEEFFRGIAVWFAPNANDENMLYITYRKHYDKIYDLTFLLDNVLERQKPILDFEKVYLPHNKYLDNHIDKRIIDNKQILMFDEMEKIRFIHDIFEDYKVLGYTFEGSERENKQKALQFFKQSKKLNISSEAGVYRYILLRLQGIKQTNKFSFYKRFLNINSESEKIKIMNSLLLGNKNGKNSL